MSEQPTAITAHTFAQLDQAEQERRRCTSAAAITQRPQGLHYHRYGEPCTAACEVVEVSGEVRPLLRDPDQAVHVVELGPSSLQDPDPRPAAVTPSPLHAPVLAPDPTSWPAVGEPTGTVTPIADPLDFGGYGPDPKSVVNGAGLQHGRDAAL